MQFNHQETELTAAIYWYCMVTLFGSRTDWPFTLPFPVGLRPAPVVPVKSNVGTAAIAGFASLALV